MFFITIHYLWKPDIEESHKQAHNYWFFIAVIDNYNHESMFLIIIGICLHLDKYHHKNEQIFICIYSFDQKHFPQIASIKGLNLS